MKKNKAIDILWVLSLIIISLITIILSVASIAEFALPLALRIVFAVLDMVALGLLSFTTVKKYIANKRKDN